MSGRDAICMLLHAVAAGAGAADGKRGGGADAEACCTEAPRLFVAEATAVLLLLSTAAFLV